jgi:hypothetical protein
MDTIKSWIWIALAVACLIYLIYRNVKLSRILNEVLSIIDESTQKCEEILAEIQKYSEPKIKREMVTRLIEEERRITNLFSDDKRWKGQAKRIKEYKKTISQYIDTARGLL